jgi:L-alanine-DL-glutamate epimerase-like enolase superfamily enzyme
MAEGMGIDVYIGNQIDTQVGTVASVVFGAAFAHSAKRAAELSNYLDMADDLLAEPLAITGGRIRVPEGPGVGTAVDEEKLSRYRTDR